jgi:hypothetical protein
MVAPLKILMLISGPAFGGAEGSFLRLSRNLAVEARMIIAVKWFEPELLRTLIK